MPKKRHQTKFSKPPSVAPPSLSISNPSSSTRAEQHDRSVNELLAAARRSGVSSNAQQTSPTAHLVPSVPPDLRQILQIPETPAPPPRTFHRPLRREGNNRRPPPGPPPPRSWFSLRLSRHAPPTEQHVAAGNIRHWPLPGSDFPEDGSLMDMILRRMVSNWPVQRDWNHFYLYTLPNKVRIPLIYYLSTSQDHNISSLDLKLILRGPSEAELAEYGLEEPDIGKLNGDISRLDLTGALSNGLSLKALGDMLFPARAVVDADLQDSWDAPEPSSLPVRLLPNLTHLSLAVSPVISPESPRPPSWRALLSISTKLATLTHLNLSGWSTPSLTPNAMAAKVVSPVTGSTTNYSATNPYSHSLDDDWVEAVTVLKRLSKLLYSLEYLDLTGCGDWFPALRKGVEADSDEGSVDWAAHWGKISTLRLCSGYEAEPDQPSQVQRLWNWKVEAVAVQSRIRHQRAGGRWITVETDSLTNPFASSHGYSV